MTPSFFLLVSILIAAYFVYISASSGSLTALEGTLLQVFTLSSGLVGSYLIGKKSTEKSSMDRLESCGQSALRRLSTLYLGLSRVAELIADEDPSVDTSSKLLAVREIVMIQILTADAAVEDWKDIVPDGKAFGPQNSNHRPEISFDRVAGDS